MRPDAPAVGVRAVGAALLSVAGAFAWACESAPKAISPSAMLGDPGTRARGSPAPSVSIPEGAGGTLAKRQPVVVMDVTSVGQGADGVLHPNSLQLARVLVEAQLPRMKRFTVYSIYNDGGFRKAQELGDTGIAKQVDESQLPAADLFLNIAVTMNVETNFDDLDGDVLTVCTATIAYNLTDSSRKVLTDTRYASGTLRTPPPPKGRKLEDMPNVRKTIRVLDPDVGKWQEKGGFKRNGSEAESNGLVRQTMEDPLKGLVARLALALPVTTQVTGLNGTKTQFSVRAGLSNGIFKGTKVVVWCEQGDFSYAIAETVAEPTMDKSGLRIVAWNDADPDAKAIIDRIRSDGIPPDLKDSLWATTEGIPLEEMLAP